MVATDWRACLQEAVLSNGARLLLNVAPESPRLAIDFLLPGGSSFDPLMDARGGVGAFDMIDRLLLKGTESRNQEAIAEAVDDLSLDLETDAARDYARISVTLLEEDLDAALALIADIFFNASFEEFDREKRRAAGELLMELDAPRARASDLFYRALFEDSPYGVTASALQENLPRLTDAAALRGFYQRAFHPSRLLVSAAGDIPMARLSAALERHFPAPPPEQRAPLPMTSPAADALSALRVTTPRSVGFARDDVHQIHLFKGWLAPAANDPDYYPMLTLHTLLGGAGLTSRLFLELRDKQGLAYQVRSVYEAFRYQGLFAMYIGADPQNRDRCLEGFRVECEKLMDAPVSEQELADTRQNILGRRAVYLETVSQQAGYIGSNVQMGREVSELARVDERIRAVSADDVLRLARRIFSQPPVIAISGPSEAIAPLLAPEAVTR